MMRAFINYAMPPAVDHSGVPYRETGILVFGLFIGIIVLCGVCTLFNRVTAARMAPCPDGQRRGLFTRMTSVLTPAEWAWFRRDLSRLFAAELAVLILLCWLVPVVRDGVYESPGFVAFMCLVFSPLALLGQLENRKTEALIHYERGKAMAAAAADTVVVALRPAGESPLAS